MALTATVFEIKRFAVHDGPGVRTAIFLKGCPLRCRWCHNPEGIESGKQIAFYDHKCLGCGECVTVCPQHAHEVTDGRHVIDRTQCIECGECTAVCLGRAVKLYGWDLSVEEACAIVLEDRDFYRDGGGVTLSGGEPLLQAEFCAELFRRLKQEEIHCAVDTSGAVAWKSFAQVLEWTDIFLFDVKHANERMHQAYVGASNRQSLDNLKRLTECGVPVEIRIPVVTNFNDDTESIEAIGRLLEGLKNIVGVRLLPYHPARSKFEAIGREAAMPEVDAPGRERMDAIAAQLKTVLPAGAGVR